VCYNSIYNEVSHKIVKHGGVAKMAEPTRDNENMESSSKSQARSSSDPKSSQSNNISSSKDSSNQSSDTKGGERTNSESTGEKITYEELSEAYNQLLQEKGNRYHPSQKISSAAMHAFARFDRSIKAPQPAEFYEFKSDEFERNGRF